MRGDKFSFTGRLCCGSLNIERRCPLDCRLTSPVGDTVPVRVAHIVRFPNRQNLKWLPVAAVAVVRLQWRTRPKKKKKKHIQLETKIQFQDEQPRITGGKSATKNLAATGIVLQFAE